VEVHQNDSGPTQPEMSFEHGDFPLRAEEMAHEWNSDETHLFIMESWGITVG